MTTLGSTASHAANTSMSSRLGDLVKLLGTVKGDLANVTAPPSFLAPASVLENPRCWAERPSVFAAPALEDCPQRRSLMVLRMYLIGLRNQFYSAGAPGVSIKKPLNAFLGELFLAQWTDGKASTRLASEQVSHHPPVTAIHIASPEHGVRVDGYARVEMKFSGGLNIRQIGHSVLHVDSFDEDFLLPVPDAQVSGFMSACLYPELWGTYKILSSNGFVSEVSFSGSSFFRSKGKNSFEAYVYHQDDPKKKPLYQVSGIWSEGWQVKDCSTGDIIETYKVDAEENQPKPMHIAPLEEQDAWESRRAWKDVISGVENGDWMAVSGAKGAIEEAQRRMRREEKANGETWEPLLFENIPEEEHVAFHRLAKGKDCKLSAAETKGVWRTKSQALENLQLPYRGHLTPTGQL